jgi:hypothetical protein
VTIAETHRIGKEFTSFREQKWTQRHGRKSPKPGLVSSAQVSSPISTRAAFCRQFFNRARVDWAFRPTRCVTVLTNVVEMDHPHVSFTKATVLRSDSPNLNLLKATTCWSNCQACCRAAVKRARAA